MNFSELQTKSTEELDKLKNDLYKEHFNLRLRRQQGDFDKVHVFKQIRRNLARIATLITTRKRDGAK